MPHRVSVLLALLAVLVLSPAAVAMTAAKAGSPAPTAPPTVTITSQPSSPTSSTASAISWTSQGATSTTCSLDSTAAFACSSPLTLTGLSARSHTLAVRVANAAGSMHALASWTISPLAAPVAPAAPPAPSQPTVTITSTPGASTNATTAAFAFSAANASAVSCSLDGGAATPCSSPLTYSALAVGQHIFAVNATSGGLSASDSFAWTVTPPPTVTIQSGPAATTGSTSATFAFAASNAATVTCSLDGAAATACTSPVTYTSLAQGPHTFVVRASSGALSASDSFAWTVTSAGAANLWVDANGGTCTRSSTPAAYVDAAACGSIQAAVSAAACNDTVDVVGGSYPAQTVTSTGCSSGSPIVVQPTPSQTVTVAKLTIANGAANTTLIGMNVAVGGQVLVTGGQSVTVQDFTAPFFDVQGGTNITIKGGTYGPCQATSTLYNCVARLIGSNQTIDGPTIFGIQTTNPSTLHTEDIFVRGCASCTIRNSTFYDTTPSDVFVQNCCSLRPTTGLVIENNWFGAPYLDTAPPYADSHGKALELDTSTPGLIVRHNSFYGWCNASDGNKCAGGMLCTGDDTTYGKTGTQCGTDTSFAEIYGNLMYNATCFTDATFNYNVVMPFSSGTGQTLCGATDSKYCTNCGAGSAHFPYLRDPAVLSCNRTAAGTTYIPCQGTIDYHVTGPTWLGDGFVTSPAYCLPSTDHDGNPRPSVNCDAGADER